MSLEGFSKRGMELGNDPEHIKETKIDLKQQYLKEVQRLALAKMKNDLLFEGRLGAAIRHLNSSGLNVTREKFLKDIQQEINRQNTGFDFNDEELVSQIEQQTVKENEQTIEGLKNDLGNIFDTPISYQESTPVNKGGTIPREPAISPVQRTESTSLNSKQPQTQNQEAKATKKKELDELLDNFLNNKFNFRAIYNELLRIYSFFNINYNDNHVDRLNNRLNQNAIYEIKDDMKKIYELAKLEINNLSVSTAELEVARNKLDKWTEKLKSTNPKDKILCFRDIELFDSFEIPNISKHYNLQEDINKINDKINSNEEENLMNAYISIKNLDEFYSDLLKFNDRYDLEIKLNELISKISKELLEKMSPITPTPDPTNPNNPKPTNPPLQASVELENPKLKGESILNSYGEKLYFELLSQKNKIDNYKEYVSVGFNYFVNKYRDKLKELDNIEETFENINKYVNIYKDLVNIKILFGNSLDELRSNVIDEMIQRMKPQTDIYIKQIKQQQELERQKEEEMRMRSNYDDNEMGRTI